MEIIQQGDNASSLAMCDELGKLGSRDPHSRKTRTHIYQTAGADQNFGSDLPDYRPYSGVGLATMIRIAETTVGGEQLAPSTSVPERAKLLQLQLTARGGSSGPLVPSACPRAFVQPDHVRVPRPMVRAPECLSCAVLSADVFYVAGRPYLHDRLRATASLLYSDRVPYTPMSLLMVQAAGHLSPLPENLVPHGIINFGQWKLRRHRGLRTKASCSGSHGSWTRTDDMETKDVGDAPIRKGAPSLEPKPNAPPAKRPTAGKGGKPAAKPKKPIQQKGRGGSGKKNAQVAKSLAKTTQEVQAAVDVVHDEAAGVADLLEEALAPVRGQVEDLRGALDRLTHKKEAQRLWPEDMDFVSSDPIETRGLPIYSTAGWLWPAGPRPDGTRLEAFARWVGLVPRVLEHLPSALPGPYVGPLECFVGVAQVVRDAWLGTFPMFMGGGSLAWKPSNDLGQALLAVAIATSFAATMYDTGGAAAIERAADAAGAVVAQYPQSASALSALVFLPILASLEVAFWPFQEIIEEIACHLYRPLRYSVILYESCGRIAAGLDPLFSLWMVAQHVGWMLLPIWLSIPAHAVWNRLFASSVRVYEIVELRMNYVPDARPEDDEALTDRRFHDMRAAEAMVPADLVRALVTTGQRAYITAFGVSYRIFDWTVSRHMDVLPEVLVHSMSPKVQALATTDVSVLRARLENSVRANDQLNYDRYELTASSALVATIEIASQLLSARAANLRVELGVPDYAPALTRGCLYGFDATEMQVPVAPNAAFTVTFNKRIESPVRRRPMAAQVFATPDAVPCRPDVDSPHLALRAVFKRISRAKPGNRGVLSRTKLRRLKRFTERFCEKRLKPLPAGMRLVGEEAVLQWLDERDYPATKKDEVWRDYFRRGTRRRHGNKGFVKREDLPGAENGYTKEARWIIARYNEFLARFGPMSVAILHALSEQCHEVVKNMRPSERIKYLIGIAYAADRVPWKSDATSAETAHVPEVLEATVFVIYRHMLMNNPDALKEFETLIRPELVGDLKLVCKWFVAVVESIKRSGEADTSLGHACYFIPATRFLVHERAVANDSPWEPYHTKFFVEEGDDMAGYLPPALIPNAADWASVGCDNTMEICAHEGYIGLCKFYASPTDMIPILNPSLFLAHLAWTPEDTVRPSRAEMLLFLKALSALYETPQAPVVAPIAHTLLVRLRDQAKSVDAYLQRERMLNAYDRKTIREAMDLRLWEEPRPTITIASRVAVEELYGVAVDEQLYYERTVPHLPPQSVYPALASAPPLWRQYFNDHHRTAFDPDFTPGRPITGFPYAEFRGRLEVPLFLGSVAGVTWHNSSPGAGSDGPLRNNVETTCDKAEDYEAEAGYGRQGSSFQSGEKARTGTPCRVNKVLAHRTGARWLSAAAGWVSPPRVAGHRAPIGRGAAHAQGNVETATTFPGRGTDGRKRTDVSRTGAARHALPHHHGQIGSYGDARVRQPHGPGYGRHRTWRRRSNRPAHRTIRLRGIVHEGPGQSVQYVRDTSLSSNLAAGADAALADRSGWTVRDGDGDGWISHGVTLHREQQFSQILLHRWCIHRQCRARLGHIGHRHQRRDQSWSAVHIGADRGLDSRTNCRVGDKDPQHFPGYQRGRDPICSSGQRPYPVGCHVLPEPDRGSTRRGTCSPSSCASERVVRSKLAPHGRRIPGLGVVHVHELQLYYGLCRDRAVCRGGSDLRIRDRRVLGVHGADINPYVAGRPIYRVGRGGRRACLNRRSAPSLNPRSGRLEPPYGTRCRCCDDAQRLGFENCRRHWRLRWEDGQVCHTADQRRVGLSGHLGTHDMV